MKEIEQLSRHLSPGGRPQPLAFREGILWIGSWDTDRIYAVDPQAWRVIEEIPAPGRPYGLAVVGNDIRAVVSIGDEDDRFFYRFVPGRGFDPDSKTPCPEFTGSHLASDGSILYLLQMGFRRILAFGEDGSTPREIALPTPCGGIGVRNDTFYIISAADEEFEDLVLATLDVRQGAPAAVPVAAMPADARALTFDGAHWWTSYRDQSEVVSFQA